MIKCQLLNLKVYFPHKLKNMFNSEIIAHHGLRPYSRKSIYQTIGATPPGDRLYTAYDYSNTTQSTPAAPDVRLSRTESCEAVAEFCLGMHYESVDIYFGIEKLTSFTSDKGKVSDRVEHRRQCDPLV